MIGWITYYELDTVGVSVLLGANAVAIYAVGKSIQQFVRSLVGIVFSPYPVRINYFIGQKDFEGLKSFFYQLSELFSIIIIPIIVIVLYAKPFVTAWVGSDYEESALIMQLLVLTFIAHHVTSQGSQVIYGLNKVKDVLKIAFIQPIFFWLGVFATYRLWGVESFAIFKLTACMVTECYYLYLVRKYLEYNKKVFYWGLVVKPLVVIMTTCLFFWFMTMPALEGVNKGHRDLLLVAVVIGASCFVAGLVDVYFNKTLREELSMVLKKVRS